MRILGIDPGLRVTGFGVIESTASGLAYIASGCLRTRGTELPERLKCIFEGVGEIVAEHAPERVAVEKVFVNINPESTLLLGQARGAAICAAVARGLPVFEHTALQVKQAVVGNGHAQKAQVQEMVRRLLNFSAPVKPDSADALACAICHAHGGLGLRQVATGFRVRHGRLVPP
jgi:crossover junction endodeoxyribonuclease RuvC